MRACSAGFWPPRAWARSPRLTGVGTKKKKPKKPLKIPPNIPATLLAVAHGSLLPALHVGGLIARGRRRRLQHGALRRGELRRHQGAAGAERGGEGGLVLLPHAWGRTEGISQGGGGMLAVPPLLSSSSPLQLQEDQLRVSGPGSLGFVSSSCHVNILGLSGRGTPFPQWLPSAGGLILYHTWMGNGWGSDKVVAKGVLHGCCALGRPFPSC